MNLRDFSTVAERRKAVEKQENVSLSHIGSFSLDELVASTRNCENMIGAVQVPLGVAGPLTISSKLQKRDVYIPLATTEGALVASVSRGCKAISKANGAILKSERIGISRAPVFKIKNLQEAEQTIAWIDRNFQKIKETAEKTSSHLTLLSLKHILVGTNIYVHFSFNSQDAMGMNMVTIATTAIAEMIEKETPAKLVAISGNMCVDKKPNIFNFINGRGIQVWAEVVLSKEVLSEILKTTPEKFVDVVTRKIYLGSITSGSIGANAHASNILAALFLATGQDMAHIAEVSSVVTTAEIVEDGVYVSIFIPDLVVGTVGGGTSLATQKEALTLLGIAGGDNGKNAEKFAEIIGAAVLAGEVSLLASISENSLACAHKKLGRGQK